MGHLSIYKEKGNRNAPVPPRKAGSYHTAETSNCVDDIRGIWYFEISKNKKEVPYEKISSHSIDTDAVCFHF